MSAQTSIEWTDRTKACSGCERVLPATAFARDASRADGLTFRCRDCRNARARALHVPIPEHERRPHGPPRLPRRDGDKRQARSRVNHDVALGFRPNPNEVPCADCGHQGPDRRHEYDHHLGYAPEHHGDVEAVCSRCHHAREASRRGG